MRRLWAYIITAFTIIVTVGATFTAIFTNASSNIEYEDGHEITFVLSDKEDASNKIFDGEDTNADARKEAVSDMAKEMESRLITAKVTRYKIAVVGDDTIKVTFAQETSEQYEQIKQYMTFNGVFAISDSGDNFAIDDEFLTDDKASLVTYNGYPTIVIPVNTESEKYKAVIEGAKNSDGETSTDSDGNETTTKYVYLWYDYLEGDNVSKTKEDSDDYDENVAKKILMRFDTENLFYPDDKENKLSAAINVDTDSDGTASQKEIKTAYQKSSFYVNLLNASKLDYKVSAIRDEISPAFIETLVESGDGVLYLSWSKTLFATLGAFLVITLFLVMFYKLGALSIFTATLLTIFGAIGFVVTIAAEFNTAAVIGLCMVAVASLTSGIVYMQKLKDDAYKGHTLKKANSEASKKSLLPIIDINLAVILVGVFSYIIGGSLMRTFAVVTVLGGLLSILVNLILVKFLMWLATNATALYGKYEYFGIKKDCVPNHMNEEQQTYFGRFQDQNFTKKKKPVSIVMSILFVAALAGTITFASINKGLIFNTGNTNISSEIYLSTEDKILSQTSLTNSKVKEMLDNITIYETKDSTGTKLSNYINTTSDIELFTYTETVDQEEKITYYAVVSLNKVIKSDVEATYTSGGATSSRGAIQDVMLEELDSSLKFSLKEGNIVTVEQPKFTPIAIASLVAVAVMSVYLMLRYRLSRGLSALFFPIITSLISVGFFVLLRLVVTPYIALLIPFVTSVTLIFSILIMNRERELVLDSKDKNKNDVARRNEIMVKATSLAFEPLSVSLLAAVYICISFFGFGPTANSFIFTGAVIGILLAALFVSTLYGPTSMLFYKWFSQIKFERKPRKTRSGNKRPVKKSGEPEEAIFIGIND